MHTDLCPSWDMTPASATAPLCGAEALLSGANPFCRVKAVIPSSLASLLERLLLLTFLTHLLVIEVWAGNDVGEIGNETL